MSNWEEFKEDTFICRTDHEFIHPMCFPTIKVVGNSELRSCPCGEIWRLYHTDPITKKRSWMNYLDESIDKKSGKQMPE